MAFYDPLPTVHSAGKDCPIHTVEEHIVNDGAFTASNNVGFGWVDLLLEVL